MEQAKFKVGLLGLGNMGKRHLEAYQSHPTVDVVTRTSPVFGQLARQDDAALYQTALCQAMIEDPTIDAIDICLPTGLHASLTIAALDAGKHVLCEKPMALNAEDCFRMLRARENSRGILMVAHVLRFWPAYRFLREVVACRAYGAIRSASLTRQSGLPAWAPWLLRPEESGGAILDMLVHDFDQALLLFGVPESARALTVGSSNVLDCVLHYAGGFEVAIGGGWHAGDVPFKMGFELMSSGGDLGYTGGHLSLLRPPEPLAELSLRGSEPYAAQLGYFVECCRKGQVPVECPPESSAQAVELACAVRAVAEGVEGEQRISLGGDEAGFQ
jgi:predicted dehydrogenase